MSGETKSHSHVIASIEVKKADGTTAIHTAEALEHKHVADGVVAVLAGCCGDHRTHSWHTFYDTAAMTPEQIRAEVQSHVDRVAQRHASHTQAMEFIPTLLKPKA